MIILKYNDDIEEDFNVLYLEAKKWNISAYFLFHKKAEVMLFEFRIYSDKNKSQVQ